MEYRIKSYRVTRDEEAACTCGAEIEAGAKAYEVLDQFTVLHTAGLCSCACAKIEIERLKAYDETGIFNLAAKVATKPEEIMARIPSIIDDGKSCEICFDAPATTTTGGEFAERCCNACAAAQSDHPRFATFEFDGEQVRREPHDSGNGATFEVMGDHG